MKKIYINAPVTIGFVLLSLGALLFSYLTGGLTNLLIFSVYRAPLTDPLAYLRIFTHVIGHASFQHYFGNISILLLIGPMLEEKYGSVPLAVTMAITALTTGVLQVIFFPGEMLLGASGIVFMMILMSSFANFRKGQIPLSLILVAMLYLGKEAADSVMVNDNISQFTHIIGGLVGGSMGYILNTRRLSDV